MKASAFTNTGNVRRTNEDHIAVNEWSSSSNMTEAKHFEFDNSNEILCLIADGMGGHRSGAMASQIAIQETSALFQTRGKQNIAELLENVNQEIYSRMDSDTFGMGTTLTGVMIKNSTATFFNVGDSRGYLISNGQIQQITIDDHLSESDRTAITQSLGGRLKRTRIEPHIKTIEVHHGDVVFLCSDGLSDVISDANLLMHIKEQQNYAVTSLFKLSQKNNSQDNVSAIAILI